MAESIVYRKWSIPRPLIYSEYKLSNLIPEKFKGTLPSIEEIESELRNKDDK